MPIVVAQIGARMHYAVPRILHGAGKLHQFYTDICAAKGWPRFARFFPRRIRPVWLQRVAARVPDGIPRDSITAFTSFGLEYARRRARASTPSETTATHLWAGRTFCDLVKRRGLDGASAVYVFNSAGLELLQTARAAGLTAVVEQTIAPREVQDFLLAEEQARFPGWKAPSPHDSYAHDFIARERAEWQAADLILCGSDFVRRGIEKVGGPFDKCAVVPYGGDFAALPLRSPNRKGTLRALFVGAVGLRKGVPYLLEAAHRIGSQVAVRLVGPIGANGSVVTDLRRHLEVTGPIARTEIRSHYEWADVFVLPSLCEGSATVCYEALAAGLPVITTPNAGSVVRDGIDGFIVPIRDSGTIAEKLELLASNRDLLAEMSRNAIERSKDFTLEKYGERLIAALRQARSQPTAASVA